ncbi:radical SAM protein [Lentisphaera profundi]|uniref:Radical SAM protein n=1 Tax=Lentisphaera profundi TaxID=1658616 RepID=A0ABY7W0A1_9BACT|nr:radical SAM protein [Lentisphaera profundi]WDE98456.1 radical SAM protein [Lentisphaera profundi]
MTIDQQKKRPGYISFQKNAEGNNQLDDLWFFTGSRCNLACHHCYVESSPTNNSIDMITTEDIKPTIDEAQKFGVNHIYFTGGEPFLNKDIYSLVGMAMETADTTIMTNATLRMDLERLKQIKSDSTLSFRISMDHFEEARHDQIRDQGNFQKTLINAVKISLAGFQVIITASAIVYEGHELQADEIEDKFHQLFSPYGVDVDVKLLPYNLEMGTNLERIDEVHEKVFLSEHCMQLPGVKAKDFQCHNGRTLQKIKGEMKIYPCPIIYNDPQYEMGSTLKDSFGNVYLNHKACYDFCYRSGGKCTN